MLRAHPRCVSHCSDDAHHAAHAARLSARLRAKTQAEHQLKGPAQLVHTDREGEGGEGGHVGVKVV